MKKHILLEAMKEFYLDQHVEKSTRVMKRNELSLLDHLLTDKSSDSPKTDQISLLGHADYPFLQAAFNLLTKCVNTLRLIYKRGIYSGMRSEMTECYIFHPPVFNKNGETSNFHWKRLRRNRYQ